MIVVVCSEKEGISFEVMGRRKKAEEVFHFSSSLIPRMFDCPLEAGTKARREVEDQKKAKKSPEDEGNI